MTKAGEVAEVIRFNQSVKLRVIGIATVRLLHSRLYASPETPTIMILSEYTRRKPAGELVQGSAENHITRRDVKLTFKS